MISSERKWFGLNRANKIKLHPYIEPYGIYHGLEDAGFFKFRYHQQFVDFVAKQFPHGIGEDRKVVIHVYQLCENEHLIVATYKNYSESHLLWKTETKPTWIGKVNKQT